MKYTKEILEKLVPDHTSVASLCRYFGIQPSTGAQTHLSKKIKEFKIDTSHFMGRGSTKGMSFPKRSAISYCFKGSNETSHRLKLKLIRDGYKEEKCECCGIKEWLDEKVVLELDHIDSDHSNNEFSNLQILCPNCHALKTRQRNAKIG